MIPPHSLEALWDFQKCFPAFGTGFAGGKQESSGAFFCPGVGDWGQSHWWLLKGETGTGSKSQDRIWGAAGLVSPGLNKWQV